MSQAGGINQRTWELLSNTGRAFFAGLVEHLATTLGVRAAFAAQAMDLKGEWVLPVAHWGVQDFRAGCAYNTRCTPCERLSSGAAGIYLDNLADSFPEDAWFVQSGMRSYAAIPLLNDHGQVIGHLGVLDDRALEDPERVINLLESFARRARAELAQLQLTTSLQRIVGEDKWVAYRAEPPRFAMRLQTLDGDDFLGYTPADLGKHDDLRGRHLFEDDRERVVASYAKALESGEDFLIEYRLWDRERGSLHRVRDHGGVEMDRQGRPQAIVGTLVDITRQRDPHREGPEREQTLLQRLGDLPGMIYRLDRHGRLLETGNGARILTGYPPSLLAPYGKTEFADLIHPQDLARVSKERDRLTALQPGFSLKYRLQRQSGEVRRVLDTGRALFSEHEELLGFEGFIIDRTQQFQTRQKLLASEQHFRALFDNSADGILFADPGDGRFLVANRCMCEMLGYSEKELLEFTVADIHRPEDLSWVLQDFHRLVRRQGGQSLDVPVKRRDGTLFHANIKAFWVSYQGKEYLAGAFRDVSENKQAEQALRLEKEKLASYLDNTAVMTLVLDSEGRVQLVNRAGCEVLGYRADEIVGKNWFEHFLPTRITPMIKQVHQQMMTGELEPVEYYENPVINARGEERLIAWHNSTLRNDEGMIVSTLSSGEDVTDERAAERALEAVRMRLQFVVTNAPAVIYACEAEFPHTISYLSDNVVEQLGYPREKLLGRSGFWSELVHPDDRKQCEQAISAFNQKGQLQQELRLRLPDGKYRWYQHNVTQVRDSKVEPVEAVGYLLDIHRTKTAELALQKREARLAHAQKLTHVGSWERDLVNGEERWSQEVFRILGYAPGAFPPSESRMLEFVHPEDRERFQENMRQGLATKEQFEFEFRVLHSNGESRIVRSLNEVVRDTQDRPVSMLGTLQDITEYRQAVAQLRHSHEELRRLADHLQSVREHERIVIAREIHDEMAQSLAAQKIDMARLRARLAQDPQLLELADGILDSMEETISVVQRILTELRPSLLDDLGLVAAIEWQVREFRRRTNICCSLKLPETEPELSNRERTTLFRILQEALSNVMRHSNATEVSLELKVDGSWMLMSVADNGKGISDLEVMGSNSFGLIGMRERMHIFGGSVTVRGKEGVGTEVIARIPFNTRRGIAN